MAEPIKISICIITYNQAQYIENAIKAAVTQKTNVPFEVVISDDRSTDCTPKICEEYQARYPGLVRFIRQEQNLGTGKHWISALRECRGRYVALCEGDDYFSCDSKIQKQFEIMERSPECSLCTHEVFVHNEVCAKTFKGAAGIWIDNLRLSGMRSVRGLISTSLFDKEQFWKRRRMYRGHKRYRDADFKKILSAQLGKHYIHTVSMFARTDYATKFPTEFLEVVGFHKGLIIWMSLFGAVKHLPDVMSTRVIQSTSSAITKREKKILSGKKSFDDPKSEFLKMLKYYCSPVQKQIVQQYLNR
mgnify:CR=1 FL=1